jgi:translation elongation factor EF-Ts
MQFSKVEIHKYFAGQYCLRTVPQTLHPKHSNLHTRHHKNLTLSSHKFQLTTKAATGASAKAAVNKFATGRQTNYFKQQHTNIFKTYLHPNLVICSMSFISNCFNKARQHAVHLTVTQVRYVKCQSEINMLLKYIL